MTEVGLVLAGGGGKGAYHISAWKAFNEYGISDNICAISGTSVGALNAALFSQGDYRFAETIWLNIEPSQILSIDTKQYISKMVGSNYLATSIMTPLIKLAKKVSKTGVFSRSDILEIINRYIYI